MKKLGALLHDDFSALERCTERFGGGLREVADLAEMPKRMASPLIKALQAMPDLAEDDGERGDAFEG